MIEFREHTLKNGMRLVMSRQTVIPNVIINTSFRVGSKDEEPGKTGISHLFEHLMFTGSENVPPGMFDEILNANGGESNAFTTQDYTSYYLSIPSSRIELGMWLDSDRIASFPVNKESLEIQKKVVLEEKKQVHDNSPFGSLEPESYKRLFTKSGYRWPIIGNENHVKNFKLQDVEEFFYRYYVPSNTVLTLTGDIDYDAVIRLAEKYYGGIPSVTTDGRPVYEEVPLDSVSEETIQDNITLPARFLFYRIPEAGSQDYYVLKLISAALSSGESSRVFRLLVSGTGTASEAYTFINGMERASIFSFNCFLNEGKKIGDASSIMDEILDEVSENGLKEEEIVKSVNKVETSYFFKIQTALRLAESLAYYKLFFDNCGMINKEVERFRIFDNEIIKTTAKKHLNKDNRVILNYVPKRKRGRND